MDCARANCCTDKDAARTPHANSKSHVRKLSECYCGVKERTPGGLTGFFACYRLRFVRNKFAALAAFAALMAAMPALAHHSFSAEFDGSKLIELKGIVTRIEWTNPHVYFYLDVKDDKGNTTNWGCEAASPGLAAPARLDS